MFALLSIPSNLGYFALGALIGVESMGVPVPGETALFAASILASRGELSIELVIVAAAIGAIVGDNIGFVIGRHGGRRLFLTHRVPGVEHRRRALASGEDFFERHGPKAVFLGRWVALLRITAAWLAGMTGMPWRTFLFYNALGGVAWAISIGLAGYFVGAAAEQIIKDVGIGAAIATGLAVVAAVLIARWRRRVSERETEVAAGPEPEPERAKP